MILEQACELQPALMSQPCYYTKKSDLLGIHVTGRQLYIMIRILNTAYTDMTEFHSLWLNMDYRLDSYCCAVQKVSQCSVYSINHVNSHLFTHILLTHTWLHQPAPESRGIYWSQGKLIITRAKNKQNTQPLGPIDLSGDGLILTQ